MLIIINPNDLIPIINMLKNKFLRFISWLVVSIIILKLMNECNIVIELQWVLNLIIIYCINIMDYDIISIRYMCIDNVCDQYHAKIFIYKSGAISQSVTTN